tara:strand:- start:65 stop:1636 length:1572 start_codon:yes stop_codon:yes gene_type:complete
MNNSNQTVKQSKNCLKLAAKGVSRRDATRAISTITAGICSGLPSSTIFSAEGLSPDALHYSTLSEISELLSKGEISSIELTESQLSRINAVDDRLNSYALVTAELARAQARQADSEIASGNRRGPLHGIPIAVKDLCYTQGIPTEGGLKIYEDYIPSFDATVMTKLYEAGAVLLGKLNLTEGAMVGYHRDFDIPINPWGKNLFAGVSSSGSGVATAAGLCYASLGSDTGGSIRLPSMANGIVGLKPTYGRVSRYGVIPLAESLDHIGPMTRSVSDAACVFQAIAGADINDPTSLSDAVPDIISRLDGNVSGLRIGVDERFLRLGAPEGLVTAIQSVIETLRSIGVVLVEVKMPGEFSQQLRDTWVTICSYEAYQAHATNYPTRASDYGEYFGEFLRSGSEVSDSDYETANRERQRLNYLFEAELSKVDAVVCPSGGVPFEIIPDSQYGGVDSILPILSSILPHNSMPADLAGTPTLTLPCGFSEEGIPYSVQFMGPRLGEEGICRLGYAYEQITDWHSTHPEL